jgi:HSP20 family protein
MTLIRWQTLPEFDTVRRQLDRLVDELTPNYEAFVKRVDITWTPAVELETKPDAFILRVQLPGIDAKTVDVQVSRNSVTVSGERKLTQPAAATAAQADRMADQPVDADQPADADQPGQAVNESADQPVGHGYIRSEFRYGKFHRVIGLPAAVQNDQVAADYADGILTLTLPREQAVRPNVVKVNVG